MYGEFKELITCPKCGRQFIHYCKTRLGSLTEYVSCPYCYITIAPLSAICKSYKSINEIENKY